MQSFAEQIWAYAESMVKRSRFPFADPTSLVITFLAIASFLFITISTFTDYWLYDVASWTVSNTPGYGARRRSNITGALKKQLQSNSGLWRICCSEDACLGQCRALNNIGNALQAKSTSGYVIGILRYSNVFPILSMLLVLFGGMLFVRGRFLSKPKTATLLTGGILFVLSGLNNVLGLIIYISNNDRLSKTGNNPSYGWSFYLAGFAFVLTEIAGVMTVQTTVERPAADDDMDELEEEKPTVSLGDGENSHLILNTAQPPVTSAASFSYADPRPPSNFAYAVGKRQKSNETVSRIPIRSNSAEEPYATKIAEMWQAARTQRPKHFSSLNREPALGSIEEHDSRPGTPSRGKMSYHSRYGRGQASDTQTPNSQPTVTNLSSLDFGVTAASSHGAVTPKSLQSVGATSAASMCPPSSLETDDGVYLTSLGSIPPPSEFGSPVHTLEKNPNKSDSQEAAISPLEPKHQIPFGCPPDVASSASKRREFVTNETQVNMAMTAEKIRYLWEKGLRSYAREEQRCQTQATNYWEKLDHATRRRDKRVLDRSLRSRILHAQVLSGNATPSEQHYRALLSPTGFNKGPESCPDVSSRYQDAGDFRAGVTSPTLRITDFTEGTATMPRGTNFSSRSFLSNRRKSVSPMPQEIRKTDLRKGCMHSSYGTLPHFSREGRFEAARFGSVCSSEPVGSGDNFSCGSFQSTTGSSLDFAVNGGHQIRRSASAGTLFRHARKAHPRRVNSQLDIIAATAGLHGRGLRRGSRRERGLGGDAFRAKVREFLNAKSKRIAFAEGRDTNSANVKEYSPSEIASTPV